MGNEQGKLLDTTTPEGVQAMDDNLQRKFAKGIQYNMKVIIRGDRNTGKTCLLHRMQGKPFAESYIPTNEIQVGHIHWTYPGTNDTVKVEIWDIVDKGKLQKKKRGLKLFNTTESDDSSQMPLDAEFLDVYKGAHCAVMMYDITKSWTWKYIEKEIDNVPFNIPVVVLGNFSDMREHRTTAKCDAEFVVTHLNRPEGAADIRYTECCMKNGFGLRFLHKFLSVPFLQMQQEMLLHQIKVNREQILGMQEELDNTIEQDYDRFLEGLIASQEQKKSANNIAKESKPSEPPAQPSPKPSPKPPQSNQINNAASEEESIDHEQPPTETASRKLSSKLSGFLSKSKDQTQTKQPKPKSPRVRSTVKDVGDFVPDGELDDDFFQVDEQNGDNNNGSSDSDEDEDDHNPQVAIDEDLSSVEEEPIVVNELTQNRPKPISTSSKSGHKVLLTESESEDENIESEQPAVPSPLPQVPLKSARDIVLTESEEEDSAVEEHHREEKPIKQKVERPSKPKSDGLLLAFNTPPLKPAESTKSSSKKRSEKKNKDLLLDVTEDSPSTRSKKNKRSKGEGKSHKKKSKPKEDESTSAQAISDPFDVNASLDAWLEDEPSPTTLRSSYSTSQANYIEEGEEQEEQPKRSKKKHSEKRRKSKSKKHSEDY